MRLGVKVPNLLVLSITPLSCIRQAREHKSLQPLRSEGSIDDIRPLLLLILIHPFIHGLTRFESLSVLRIDKWRPEIGYTKYGSGSFKCIDERLSVIKVGRHHLNTLGLQILRCEARSIASDTSDSPAWLFEKGSNNGTSLGAGCANDDDQCGDRHEGASKTEFGRNMILGIINGVDLKVRTGATAALYILLRLR